MEVQRLLALIIDEGVEVALELPDQQRAEQVTEGNQQAGKGRKVADVFKEDQGYYGWIMQSNFTLDTKRVLTNIRLRESMKK